MTTDEIWKYLQNHNYFLNHRLYNKFEVLTPSYVELSDIQNKIVLDVGNGYGRHLAWFSHHASLCFGIEICKEVIAQAKEFITKNGNIKKTKLLLASDYERFLVPLDYVFCRFVFQHITKDQGRAYINMINKYLKIEGKINLQFRLGNQTKIEQNKEPIIEYTLEELDELLQNFEINNMNNLDNHVYIVGTKLI